MHIIRKLQLHGLQSRDVVAGGRRLSQPMSYIKACQVRRIAFVGDLSSSYDAAVFFLT
jgi:hypothetical protein